MKEMTGIKLFKYGIEGRGVGLWAEQPSNVRLLFTIVAAQQVRLDQLDSDHGAESHDLKAEIRELEGRVEKLEQMLDDHMSCSGEGAHPL